MRRRGLFEAPAIRSARCVAADTRRAREAPRHCPGAGRNAGFARLGRDRRGIFPLPRRNGLAPSTAPRGRAAAEHFTIPAPPDKVFAMFGDVKRVAACLPGVSLTSNPTAEHVEGLIRVKLGPISAGFRGSAHIERDPDTMSGRISEREVTSAAVLPPRAKSAIALRRSKRARQLASRFRSVTVCKAYWRK